MCSLWQDLSNGTIKFLCVTLTVTFDLLIKKSNIAAANLHNALRGPSWLCQYSSYVASRLIRSICWHKYLTSRWQKYATIHNSNWDTNLFNLSEETAWCNIMVFVRTKYVATRLSLLLFVKIPLKFFGPANFDSVLWNIALHQTECPVKYFYLREVWQLITQEHLATIASNLVGR